MKVQYTDRCETYRVYGIVCDSSGAPYVMGNLDLLPLEYDPIPRMPEILMSLLHIGSDFAKGKDIALFVQGFCSKYGMLGFQQALIEKTYDDGSVKFYSDNVLHCKAATENQLAELFIPFPAERKRQMWRRSILRMQDYPPEENGEPTVVHLDYARCEAVSWYGAYGQQLYELLRKYLAGEAMTLMPGNAELRYEVNAGAGQRRLYFDSLKSACDFYTMDMLTSPAPTIRLCKRCGKPLLTNGTRTKYCSASCRNVANVSNSRKRKRVRNSNLRDGEH